MRLLYLAPSLERKPQRASETVARGIQPKIQQPKAQAPHSPTPTSMCGIIGYIGPQQAAPILLEGLRRLEYRGYDSAGVSVLDHADLQTRKKKGKIDEGLGQLLLSQVAPGQLGIGHKIGRASCRARV